jgi:plasmid stability protein
MATLTVRNVDDAVKRVLRRRAAEHGVSVEQEIRTILREATMPEEQPRKGAWRLKASKEEILALGQKPQRPFDLKALTDHMWDEGLL